MMKLTLLRRKEWIDAISKTPIRFRKLTSSTTKNQEQQTSEVASRSSWKPFGKLKEKAKEYGPFFFVYYSTVYVSTGLFIYGLFHFNVLNVDAVKMKFKRFLEYIEKPELFKYYEEKQIPVKWETFGRN